MNLFSEKFIKGIIGNSITKLMVGVCLSSCSPDIKNNESKNYSLKVLDEFNIVFPHLNLDESWELNIEQEPSEEYLLQLEKKDSLAVFNNIWLQKSLVKSDGISDINTNVCYSIPNIFYYWFDGKEGKMIEYNERLDTLWEYKHIGEITDLNQEIFIRGKYQYLYSNYLLSSNQRKYFEVHRDSLRKVEGNNLPKLPEIAD